MKPDHDTQQALATHQKIVELHMKHAVDLLVYGQVAFLVTTDNDGSIDIKNVKHAEFGVIDAEAPAPSCDIGDMMKKKG